MLVYVAGSLSGGFPNEKSVSGAVFKCVCVSFYRSEEKGEGDVCFHVVHGRKDGLVWGGCDPAGKAWREPREGQLRCLGRDVDTAAGQVAHLQSPKSL